MMALASIALAIVVVALVALLWREQRNRRLTPSPRRILFPFTGTRLSERALDAALRLAVAERATLVPVYLAVVPMQLPIETPLPAQCSTGMPLLETIEQRAAGVGIPIDSRVATGRTLRHALTRVFADERFDRIVIAAASTSSDGFSPADVAWLLENAPGEVAVLRPQPNGREANDHPAPEPAPRHAPAGAPPGHLAAR